ncbi:hypothetical protein ACHAXA_005829 [Cyclostephanos tholiformis]|uniref:Uncharacterized protein n=1 Tax=Cyclostephanos tholiformis TaxID=382380 RepID=A0ABD3S040_9STRA
MMLMEDTEILEYALLDYLSGGGIIFGIGEEGGQDQSKEFGTVLISSVTIEDQKYDRPCVDAVVVVDGVDGEQGDGSGDSSSIVSTTSLDITTGVIGSYIPSYQDEGDEPSIITDELFGNMIANAINSNEDAFVVAMKEASSTFFGALLGVYAIEEGGLAESPSSSPSSPPTRDYEQAFEMDIDSNPTGSYGIVFEIGTPRYGNTIMLTSISFVTLHTGKLEYEIYTKLGSFEKYLGNYASFDLIASGQVNGMGSSKYTRVLDNDTIVEGGNESLSYVGFRPVYVLGDGGKRSFYITITKRFVADDGSAIPLLFSPPIDGIEGSYDYALVDSNSELEVYEGDGILEYPWPRVTGEMEGDDVYYRRPRGFFGSFEYNRVPCYPTMNFTGWPCPYAFTEPLVSIEEVENPIMMPSVSPSRNPTGAPEARDDAMDNSSAARNDGIEEEDKDPTNFSASMAMWIAQGNCILWIIRYACSLLLSDW